MTLLGRRLEGWLFSYSDKKDISIHRSTHIPPAALLLLRLISWALLTARLTYALAYELHSLLSTVLFLTEVGFNLTWIYNMIVLIDFLLTHKSLPSSTRYTQSESGWATG